MLRPATTARIFKVPDLCRPHDFVSKLLSSTFQGLWQTGAASSGRTEADRALSHHPVRALESKGREIRALSLPTTAEGVEDGVSEEGEQTKIANRK